MRQTQVLGRLNPFVDPGRRHPDVREDDVGPLGFHRGEQRVQVAGRGNDLDVGMRLEQPARALADEIVVVGEHETNRHPSSLGRLRQ